MTKSIEEAIAKVFVAQQSALKNQMGLRWDNYNVPYRIFKNPPEFQSLVKRPNERTEAFGNKNAHNQVNGKNTRDY